MASVQLDGAESVALHHQIIRRNRLLKAHYTEIYQTFQSADEQVRHLHLPSLEIGSGGGYLKEFIPEVITSDVVMSDGLDRIEDAVQLSFPDQSLKAVYAMGVLHHIPEPQKCLAEIQRVLAPGGVFVCYEPSSTPFGYFMNRHFHREWTDKTVTEWIIPREGIGGRLTGANMAIPYIIFKRDRALFKARFPNLKVRETKYIDFLRYTLSGGLSFQPFVPTWLFGAVNSLEWLLKPLLPVLGNGMILTMDRV